MQNNHSKHPSIVSLKDGIYQVLGSTTPCQQAMDSRSADFSTGISSLDEKLLGLYRGDLVFIRECSFECSTCLDAVLARNVAVKGHGTVLYVSKYHATDLAARLMTAECGIPYDTMAEGRLTGEQWQQIGIASAALSTLPIFADETTDFSLEYLHRRCAEIPDLDMLVVSRFLDDPLPCADYRLWYGNADYVLWYNIDGQLKMASMSGHRHDGKDRYFQESISWSFISSSNFGVRYTPTGFAFDVAGSSMFLDNEIIKYITGLLCSCLGTFFMEIQNPTLNFQVGNLKNVPVIVKDKNRVDSIVNDAIKLSKGDWDSYETSWDFKRNPLV